MVLHSLCNEIHALKNRTEDHIFQIWVWKWYTKKLWTYCAFVSWIWQPKKYWFSYIIKWHKNYLLPICLWLWMMSIYVCGLFSRCEHGLNPLLVLSRSISHHVKGWKVLQRVTHVSRNMPSSVTHLSGNIIYRHIFDKSNTFTWLHVAEENIIESMFPKIAIWRVHRIFQNGRQRSSNLVIPS